jgi:hypothetical protein
MNEEQIILDGWSAVWLAVRVTILALGVIGAWYLIGIAVFRIRRALELRRAHRKQARIIPAGTVMTVGEDGKLRPWRRGDRPDGVLVNNNTDLLVEGTVGWDPAISPVMEVVWVTDRYDSQRQIEAVETAECPICGAAVGEQCNVGHGDGDGFHLVRESKPLGRWPA